MSLTSNEGIYRRQQDEKKKFSQSSEDVHNSIAKNSASSAQQISEVCGDFAEMNKAIVDVHSGRAETDLEVKKLTENITEIQRLIHDIQDVSARTNLLSFNASMHVPELPERDSELLQMKLSLFQKEHRKFRSISTARFLRCRKMPSLLLPSMRSMALS